MSKKVKGFKPGSSVYYPTLGRYGTVRTIINLNDPADIRAQGLRYEVWFQTLGWAYSVPQSRLTTSKI